MRSRNVQQMGRDQFDKTRENSEGVIHSLLLFNAERITNGNIPDYGVLPVVENAVALQNGSGLFYFMPGYSLVGGADIIP